MMPRETFTCVLALYGVLLVQVEQAWCSQQVMQSLSMGFTKVLEQCKKEENVGDRVMQDFYNFWHEEYELVNREMGCVMMCMAAKLELIDENMRMHHGNALEFAKTHGADETLAKQLVDLVHECEKTHASIEDRCIRALETTKCFRAKIHGLKWAPSMRIIMEEVMTAL